MSRRSPKPERLEARDPSTPPARLAALLEDHPDAVLENPALPLLLLEQPDFWRALSPAARLRLAQSARCPPAFARWAIDQRVQVHAVMQNAALPASLRRDALFAHAAWSPRWSTLRRSMQGVLPPHEALLLDRSMAAVGDGVHRVRLGLSPLEFEALAALGHLGASHALSALDCPPGLLARFALAPSADLRLPALAQGHPSLPAPALAQALASPELRFGAASNPGMTAAQFASALDEPELFEPLARNPGLPADAARWLATRCFGRALQSLARNPALPVDVQVLLAQSEDRDVRAVLSARPALADEARQALGSRP